MPDSCSGSRHFSWLVKSCIPSPHHHSVIITAKPTKLNAAADSTTISSLPEDLLLDILSRLPLPSLPPLSLVSRRWSLLLDSPLFLHLRRRHRLLLPTLLILSLPDQSYSPHLLASTLRLRDDSTWTTASVPLSLPPDHDAAVFDLHARLVSTGRRVYILARDSAAEYDSWTGSLKFRRPMPSQRKKFAAAAVSGKIYVAGGSARTSAVEEYDPAKDEWRVVSDAPRRRYGCIGVGVQGLFCVIGGLKIAYSCELPRAAAVVGMETQMYANSMDVYDVEGKCWLRSRNVPGGGCVVAACGAGGDLYVLASHAVYLSFWRFRTRRRSDCGGGGRFGEWCRMRSPPVPAHVRLDSTARFWCVGVEDKVALIQGGRGGGVLVFDCAGNEWCRVAAVPEVLIRAVACVCVEC